MSKARVRVSEFRDAIVDFLVKRDGRFCAICKLEIKEGHETVDHITPIYAGGKSTLENYRILHFSCNIGEAKQEQYELHGPPPPPVRKRKVIINRDGTEYYGPLAR